MFKIDSKYYIDSDIPFISCNYQIIHFDEVPILFTGTNEYGERIMGSLCGESEDGETYRYFHTVLKNIDYVKFIKGKISYRTLIETAKRIFIIDKDVNNEIKTISHCPINEIPSDYLPLPDIFCPQSILVFGSEFTISLKGLFADIHEAINSQVNIISKNYAQFLATITDSIKQVNLIPEIRQQAYSPTSFGINFRIMFKSTDMFFNKESEKALSEYVTKTINYSINSLPNEALKLKSEDIKDTEFQKTVIQSLEKTCNLLNYKFDDKIKEKTLKNMMKVPFELEKITEQLGQGFEYLEIISENKEENIKGHIGLLDNDFSRELANATKIIEEYGASVHIDDFFETYQIHVYHLNIESRRGNAHYKNKNEGGEEILDTPKFIIEGNSDLDGSDFTKSMDKGIWIDVKAKARKVNNRVKMLTIQFQ